MTRPTDTVDETIEPTQAEEPDTAPEPGPFQSWPYVDRRMPGTDRRARQTTIWQAILTRGQRAEGRRKGEDSNIYVDVYRGRDIAIVLLVLILNVLDAYFTLDYIEKGGAEANPVAQSLLDLGNTWFIYAKSVVVGVCLIFLLVHRKFSYVGWALGFLTTFYGLLLFYHLFLQARYYLTH